MISENTVLTPIIHHFHSNAYIGNVEMIDENSKEITSKFTVRLPLLGFSNLHHGRFHSSLLIPRRNAYTNKVRYEII